MGAKRESTVVAVEIYGQTYKVLAEEDIDYQGLARFVDTKMREIEKVTGTREQAKLAILAALNIADELRKLETSAREDEQRVAAATREMLDELTETLREPTQTSPAAP